MNKTFESYIATDQGNLKNNLENQKDYFSDHGESRTQSRADDIRYNQKLQESTISNIESSQYTQSMLHTLTSEPLAFKKAKAQNRK